jgi:hypothetical protein
VKIELCVGFGCSFLGGQINDVRDRINIICGVYANGNPRILDDGCYCKTLLDIAAKRREKYDNPSGARLRLADSGDKACRKAVLDYACKNNIKIFTP